MPNSRTIFNQKTTALEKVWVPKLITIINRYRSSFISDLKAYGKDTAINNLQKTMAPDSLTRSIDLIYRKAGLMGARMTAQELSLQAKKVQKKAAGFGRNERWIMDVIAYLKLHMIGFVQDITDTMREDILRVLQRGVDQGWGIDQTVRELRQSGLIEARARVIARTEIIRAANVGHSVAAASSPYEVDKKWSAARDSRTRHSHVFIHNHQVDEHGYFKVPIYKGDKNTGQFDSMLYPGDPNASPGNSINCRCRVIYVPKRDARGRLVLRDNNVARVVPMRQVPRIDPAQIAAQLKANIKIGVE